MCLHLENVPFESMWNSLPDEIRLKGFDLMNLSTIPFYFGKHENKLK